MRLSLFYQIQVPKPWTAESEAQRIYEALEQIPFAEQQGFSAVWFSEHHFRPVWSHNSAPDLTLAAVSQRTERIRLGIGVVLAPIHHPLHIAQRMATLDILSRGRVDVGLGRTGYPYQLTPYGSDLRDTRGMWQEFANVLPRIWTQEEITYEGEYFKIPRREVLPKPLQKPHPPLWVACSQLDTIEMAGRRGIGALAFQFLSADAAHAWVHAYYNSFTKRLDKLTDYVTNPNIALTSYFMCAETDEEARRRADGIPFFQFALRFYGQSAFRKRPDPGTVNLWDEYEKWKRESPDGLARALAGGLIGSPETLRRKLRRFETSHIDQVILLNQAGKNTHAHICESLELFAREVMPEFHARIPEQEAWKRQVLAREIELEEIDTAPFRDRYGPNSVQVRPQAAE